MKLMTLGEVLLGSLVGGVLSILVTAYVLRSLPVDYFRSVERRRPKNWLRNNIVGWLLIFIGIALSIPGVPGQGLLTILAGVILADFPKKTRLERWLMRKPAVFRAANALRRRMGKPEFIPAEPEGAHEALFR